MPFMKTGNVNSTYNTASTTIYVYAYPCLSKLLFSFEFFKIYVNYGIKLWTPCELRVTFIFLLCMFTCYF